MIQLTDLEKDVLRGIYASEYDTDSVQPSIWSFAVRAKVATAAQIPALVGSLQKKGLLVCSGRGNDSTITVTEEGMQAAVDHAIIRIVDEDYRELIG